MNARGVVALVSLLCLLPGLASGSWREAMPDARLVGEGTLRIFGFRIYDARLWSPTAPLQARTPFALELTYHRSISRDDFVRTSLDEMKRLSGPDLDASVPARWREHMQQAFVDVRPGERITYAPGWRLGAKVPVCSALSSPASCPVHWRHGTAWLQR